jgi:hypothetical protein
MITPIVHALRENGRIVDDAYMRYLKVIPIQALEHMYTEWCMPRFIW